ncbi:MAG: ankyrin repeat domain-containing protein [Candidatus Aminicenantes bacterium]
MKYQCLVWIVAFLTLLSACSSPQKKALEQLDKSNIEYNEKNFLDHVVKGNKEVVILFLEAGMSPDVEEADITALMEASRRGHTSVALDLMEAGADIDAKDDYGVTALMYAAISGSTEIMQKLIEQGADVNAKSQNGRTALVEVLTSENDHPPGIIQSLMEAGAEVNVRICQGLTPLMLAASGNPEIVKMLIEAGADVNAKDDHGTSVLMRAKYRPENVEILKEAGAKK